MREEFKMRKFNAWVLLDCIFVLCLLSAVVTGCTQRQSDKVSYNLSLEADNFNVIRQLTFINIRTDDILFQMTGNLSIKTDNGDGQLEIVVKDGETYRKHFIRLNEWVTYVVEDVTVYGTDVNNYKYTLNYNPKMWVPLELKTIE
jgi:hypothetical protein